MTLERFKQLVSGGEKATVDFKLVCNAFNKASGDQDKARAELVKDICAMANNGAATSYLIIGVGNDREKVQSVTDPNLKSEIIQSLIRDAIHPRPFVRVLHRCWDTAPKPFGGVKFVIIQIGPNAKHAFRLAKDYINWSERFHFRKNEVWVRNEDTSDLATPEQVIALAGRGSRPVQPPPDFTNTDYRKLAKADQLRALAQDAAEFFDQRGFLIESAASASSESQSEVPKSRLEVMRDRQGKDRASAPGFWVVVPLRGKKFLFHCCFEEQMRTKGAQAIAVSLDWRLEHGLWIFLFGNLTPSAVFSRVAVDVKEPWGLINLLVPKSIGWVRNGSMLPKEFGDIPITVLSQPRLTDTKRLRESLAAALASLENDDSLFSHLDNARLALDTEIRRWRKMTPADFEKSWSSYETENAKQFAKTVRSVTALLNKKV